MKSSTVYIVSLMILLFVSSAQASEMSGNVNFFLGQKTLNDDAWESLGVEKQGEFGILIDFKKEDWPVSIALDFLGSSDKTTISGIEFEGTTTEFDIGIRKIVEIPGSALRPFIGGGFAFVKAEAVARRGALSVSVDDSATGFWFDAGAYVVISEHFNLGVEARYSDAEVRFGTVDLEAGGRHVGVILGYHW